MIKIVMNILDFYFLFKFLWKKRKKEYKKIQRV